MVLIQNYETVRLGAAEQDQVELCSSLVINQLAPCTTHESDTFSRGAIKPPLVLYAGNAHLQCHSTNRRLLPKLRLNGIESMRTIQILNFQV